MDQVVPFINVREAPFQPPIGLAHLAYPTNAIKEHVVVLSEKWFSQAPVPIFSVFSVHLLGVFVLLGHRLWMKRS